jgi:hypothetical protein
VIRDVRRKGTITYDNAQESIETAMDYLAPGSRSCSFTFDVPYVGGTCANQPGTLAQAYVGDLLDSKLRDPRIHFHRVRTDRDLWSDSLLAAAPLFSTSARFMADPLTASKSVCLGVGTHSRIRRMGSRTILRMVARLNPLNNRLHANAAIALLFQIEHHRRGVGDPGRSASEHA